MLRKEHLTIFCGFSFPKFNSENGDGYFSVLNNLCDVHNEILYGMPIIEDKKVMYKEHRLDELNKIQGILKKYDNHVLNITTVSLKFKIVL